MIRPERNYLSKPRANAAPTVQATTQTGFVTFLPYE